MKYKQVLIPEFGHRGVLPPFLGDPLNPSGYSPYHVDMVQLARRFQFSEERKKILRGFLAFRKTLASLGLKRGFQWVDGSFVEDREPADLDLVNFIYPSETGKEVAQMEKTFDEHQLLSPHSVPRYCCDSFFVDLDRAQIEKVVKNAVYWYGLFSHQRHTTDWKGMVQVPLFSPQEDREASLLLEGEPLT